MISVLAFAPFLPGSEQSGSNNRNLGFAMKHFEILSTRESKTQGEWHVSHFPTLLQEVTGLLIQLCTLSGRGDKDIFNIAEAMQDEKWQQFIREKASLNL